MKTKSEIVDNWLVRYTGLELNNFGEYILLTNFDKYVNIFAERLNCEVQGENKNITHRGLHQKIYNYKFSKH